MDKIFLFINVIWIGRFFLCMFINGFFLFKNILLFLNFFLLNILFLNLFVVLFIDLIVMLFVLSGLKKGKERREGERERNIVDFGVKVIFG